MADQSALAEYTALLGHEVNFITKGSGKASRGVLKHISRSKHGLYTATVEVKWKLGWTRNETVPINHVMKDVQVPKQKPHDDDSSIMTIPNLGIYRKCIVEYFDVGDSVIWSPAGAPEAAGLVGVILFIGNCADHNYRELYTMAVVNFDQPTGALPYFMGNNRNAVPIQQLKRLPTHQVTPIPSGSNSNGSGNHAPRPLEFHKVPQSEVDHDSFKTYSYVKQQPTSSQCLNQATCSDAKPSISPSMDIQVYTEGYQAVKIPAAFAIAKPLVKGIQGSNNSCYIDASLFALFAYHTGLDNFSLSKEDDNEVTTEVKAVLRDRILTPLRESQYVPSKNVNALRDIFAKTISQQYSVSFMDAEEFMLSLFELLRIPELFQYDNEATDHIHQIILPQGWDFRPYVTVQTLLERSFQESSVKLTFVPTCFIVKLPVSNGVLVSSKAVIPSLTLGLRPLLCDEITASTRDNPPMLHLSAVVCLRNNHFVTFAKNGIHDGSPWFFMDSNPTGSRPELTEAKLLHSVIRSAEEELYQSVDYMVTEPHCKNGRRLFRDAYICVYVTK